MNAISSLNNLYPSYAMWSAPEASAAEVAGDLGPMDDYAGPGAFESDTLASLDAGDQFAAASLDEGMQLDGAAPAEGSELESGCNPIAADINGEMWFFSAGSGGAAADWGGLAGLD